MKELLYERRHVKCYDTGIQYLFEEYGVCCSLYANTSSYNSGPCKYYYDADESTDNVEYLGEFDTLEKAVESFSDIIEYMKKEIYN